MNARTEHTEVCTRLSLKGGLGDAWHRRRCADCRTAARADSMIRIALDCMRAEHEIADAGPAGKTRDRIGAIMDAIRIRPVSGGARIAKRMTRATFKTMAAVSVLVVAVPLWTLWLDRDPGVDIAMTRMPSPNAFRYFQEAGMALSGGGPFVSAAIDDVAMRLPYMTEVDSLPVGTLMPPAFVSAPTYTTTGKPPDLEEAARIVEAHAPSLARLREGLRYPYAQTMTASLYDGSAHLQYYRSLARLLALDGYVKLKRGKPKDAVASYLDALRFGIAVQQGAPRAGRLVGLICAGIGRAGLWAALKDLDAETARYAAAQIQQIAGTKPPIGAMFAADRRIGSAMLAEATSSRFWRLRGWMAISGERNDRGPWWSGPVNYISTLPASRKRLIWRYNAYVSSVEDQATWPYPRTPTRTAWGRFDFFGKLFLENYSHVLVMNDLDTAQNQLLAVALASHAYHRQNGRDAPSIQRLVDAGMLRRVPTDPFDPRAKPLRYTEILGETVIYSIGPDACDDGGVPAMPGPDVAGAGQLCPFTETAIGDIVAGKTVGLQVRNCR